jgi:hypothetical protein
MYLNPIQVVILFAFCVLIGSLLLPYSTIGTGRKMSAAKKRLGAVTRPSRR